MSDLLVALDVGTQSVRAGIVDATGEIVGIAKVDAEPYYSTQPGYAEQRPEYFWENVCTAIGRVLVQTGVDRGRIAGVTLSTQRQTVVVVDESGEALRPAIVWMDARRADATKLLPKPLLEATRVAGVYDVIKLGIEYSRSNWLQQNEPETWQRTHKFLYLSGYLSHQLTGEFADSSGNVFGPVPFEVRTGEWVGPRHSKARVFPIEPEKLPDLVKPGEVIGTITAAAAEATGLPSGLPVVAGASDKACDLLGAGVLSPDVGYISYGTTATFNVFTEKYVELQRMLPPYPAAVPGAFHTEVQIMRGLWLVSWFSEEFGLRERELAAGEGRSPEELLDELIADIPAGSMGLVTEPTWSPGPQSDPAAKGAVFGFGDVHTRAHLYRSILEGLAMSMGEGAEATVKKTKVPLTSVRASGGGSRSDVLMQITADVFNLQTHRAHTPETSTVGAAVLAAAGSGVHPSIEAAAGAMTRTAEVFEPLTGNIEVYRRLRTEVFRKAPGRLGPLFRSIRAITGYPT